MCPKSVYRSPNGPKIPTPITVYIYIKYFMKDLLDSFSPITDPLHFVFSPTLYFFVFLIRNKIYLNRWKQNSQDILNCNIWNIIAKNISLNDKRTTQVMFKSLSNHATYSDSGRLKQFSWTSWKIKLKCGKVAPTRIFGKCFKGNTRKLPCYYTLRK